MRPTAAKRYRRSRPERFSRPPPVKVMTRNNHPCQSPGDPVGGARPLNSAQTSGAQPAGRRGITWVCAPQSVTLVAREPARTARADIACRHHPSCHGRVRLTSADATRGERGPGVPFRLCPVGFRVRPGVGGRATIVIVAVFRGWWGVAGDKCGAARPRPCVRCASSGCLPSLSLGRSVTLTGLLA